MKNKKKAITFGISLAVFAGLSVCSSQMKKSLVSQNMADRWSSDGSRYAQVSVFMPSAADTDGLAEVHKFREFIENKLNSESYRSVNDEAKVWNDAWSSVMTSVKVNTYDEYSGKKTECQSDINIIGTGGDFFEFHPLELDNGSYIYSDTLQNSGAVLDENAAWKIFSSLEVTGMKFFIGEKEFVVSGVVKPEKNRAVKTAYPSDPIIYVHYSALKETESNQSLGCYESVLPNPVSGYARNMILAYYGIDTMSGEDDPAEREESLSSVIVDNTNRFSDSVLYSRLKSFGKEQAVLKPIAFPYWENAARINTAWLTAVFFIKFLTAAYIIIMLIIFTVKLYLRRTWRLKDCIEKLTDKYTYKKKISDYINVETESYSEREKKYE